MDLLGIDYGEKRVGLALADYETKIATPYKVLENKSDDFIIGELKKICKEERIGEIVVGLPISLKGKAGSQAKKVLQFLKLLKRKLRLPVKTEDERLTSAMVNKLAKKQKVERDAVAAMLILQSYLERQK